MRKRRLGKVRPAAVGALCAVVAILIAIVAIQRVPAAHVADDLAKQDAGAPSPVAVERPDGVASEGDGAAADASSGVSAPARTPSGMEVPEELIPDIEAEHEQDVVLVSLEQGYTAEELMAAIDASGCTVPQTITDEDIALGFVELTVADGYDVAHAMTQLEMLPETAAAQPNYLYSLQDDGLGEGAEALKEVLPDYALTASNLAQAVSINDPYRGNQWMLNSINAFDAWGMKQVNHAVTVAVIDNGCYIEHEDLKENIVDKYNAAASENRRGLKDVTPFSEHGTHVCGIVAAQANNSKGIAGVSYNARLLPIQAFHHTSDGDTATSSAIARAYNYIIEHADDYNIKVVNMSLGATVTGSSIEEVALDSEDDLLINGVNKAYDAGILTVCSSGNDASKQGGAYINYPSDWLDNALGVIALQNATPPTRASYSNYNMHGQTTKDIAAPGSNIYSTVLGNASYSYMGGTSMASPCVAGVAALVFASEPNLTPAEVSDILCISARDLGSSGWDTVYGYGEVDAAAAVRSTVEGYVLQGDPSVLVGSSVALAVSSAGSGFTWSSSNPGVATVDDNGLVQGRTPGTAKITISKGGKTVARKTITVYGASFAGPTTVRVGESISLQFSHEPVQSSWTFSSSDRTIATLGNGGTSGSIGILGVAPGTVDITATLASNPKLVARHTITVLPIEISKASIASIATQTYTGKALAPNPVVTYRGRVLEKNVDYTVKYVNNVKVGTATMTITGCGDFTGTATTTFTIAKSKVAVPKATNRTYTGSLQTGIATGSSYRLAGTLSAVDVGTYTATAVLVDPANTQWADGGTANKHLVWEVSPASIWDARISLPHASNLYAYTGSAITPTPTVSLGSRILRNGTDYTVFYVNNVNIGSASVFVTGKGNYAGSKGVTFQIVSSSAVKRLASEEASRASKATPVSKASISCAAWAYYTGKAIKPNVTVKLGSRTLKAGTDFTVSYANNRKVGTATVTVKGKGDYTGAAERTFKIVRVPSFAGATSMPVGSTASWKLSGCTFKVAAGGDVIGISGKTVTAKKAGTARIAIFNAVGEQVAVKTVRVYNLSGTTRTVRSAVSQSYVLDISGGSKKNGANLQLYRNNGTKAQKFKFTLLDDGTYRIANVKSGRVFDVAGGSKKSCANIQQYRWSGKNAQRWRITVDASNRVTFINKRSGCALDLKSARAASGQNIRQYTPNGTKAQKWWL